MGECGPSPIVWQNQRRHPRVSLDIPVELRRGEKNVIARSANLSIGGILIRAPQVFPVGTEIGVRFNLPDGHSITSRAKVIYVRADANMGLEFLHLSSEDYQILSNFTAKMVTYVRRGGRIAQRYLLLVRGSVTEHMEEQVAETVLLSRHGGLFVCRAAFKIGEQIDIWWREKSRGAAATVVFRQLGGPGGLIEVGFEFKDPANFWELDFPAQAPFC
jgi:hypothetical protein